MRRFPAALLFLILPTVISAQTTPDPSAGAAAGDTITVVAPVEVLGSRVGDALPGTIRPVDVLDRNDLASRPLRSVADALGHQPAVIVGQRQAHGVQSDLSVRGSSFDQVQVLLDGFDLSDPQTGHHLMSLPLTLLDLERIEVMPGHGSVLYGSGAFGGTVNLAPRRPTRGSGGTLGAVGGPDGLWAIRGDLNLSRSSDPTSGAPLGEGDRGIRVSAERFRSDGHEVDGQWSGRDADRSVVTVRAMDVSAAQLTDVFLGLAHRDFGARDFYTPTLAHEVTSTLVTTLRHRRDLGSVVVEARAAGRRHRDRFTLSRANPQRYQNDHLTHRALAGLRASAPMVGAWSLAGDLEAAYEAIDSEGIRGGAAATALGHHIRRRASLGLELSRNQAPIRLQFGTRLDTRENLAPRLGASAAAAYEVDAALAIQASVGSVFRVPTFTDLHYRDPYSQGDPDLEPESGWAWDAGVRFDDGRWLLAATYFERHEDRLIDWARAAGDTVWTVTNVADGEVKGVELQGGVQHPRGHRLVVGWQNLHQERRFAPGTESRYGLITPRQHLTGTATIRLLWNLESAVSGRYLHRSAGPADFREVAVFSARLRWRHGRWTVDADLHNLGDRRYEDVPGAVMPGRSAMVGVTMMY